MAVTMQERPYEISWSKNQIRYVLQTDTALATEGLAIELRLYFKVFNGIVFEQVYSQPAYADANGIVEFYPQAILDAMLEYKLPTVILNTLERMDSQAGLFYLEYREVTTAVPDPAWISDQATTLYVLKGGLSTQRWQGGNYFVTYFQTYKPFLTWRISGGLCGLQERMYLYFLMPRAANGTVSVKVKVVYTDQAEDNSLSLQFPDVPAKYAMYAIPAGVAQLDLQSLTPAKRIYYYEISVEDAGGVLATAFRYLPDYRNSYNKTQFNFINSLGGMDSVRVLGEIETAHERETETAEITSAYNINENYVALHEFMSAVTVQEQFKGNAGFVGKKEQQGLSDLFYTRNVWEARFNRWWPVIITSKSYVWAKSTDDLYTVPLEWAYGFRNTQFTPDYSPVATFGTCPLITNPQVTHGAEQDTLSWTGSVAHTKYRVHLFLQLTAGSPVGQQYIFTAVPSVVVDQGYRSWAYIKAVCAYNESAEVGPIQIREV